MPNSQIIRRANIFWQRTQKTTQKTEKSDISWTEQRSNTAGKRGSLPQKQGSNTTGKKGSLPQKKGSNTVISKRVCFK